MSRRPAWLDAAAAKWRYRGRERPDFAEDPGPGQESVWDYPRPPAVAPESREVVVRHGPREVARSTRALRALETASPPTVYLPRADVDERCLEPGHGSSLCEWKGEARYWSVRVGDSLLENVAWDYPEPFDDFGALREHLCFYPGRVECYLGGVRVRPQPGRFYGGWMTPEIVGPVKGEPGSGSW